MSLENKILECVEATPGISTLELFEALGKPVMMPDFTQVLFRLALEDKIHVIMNLPNGGKAWVRGRPNENR